MREIQKARNLPSLPCHLQKQLNTNAFQRHQPSHIIKETFFKK